MTEAKHRGAEDERSSAVSVDSGPLCPPRGRRRDESDVGIRWPAIRQRTCGPVRTRNHGRHARSRAGSRRVQRRLGSAGINTRREPNHASGPSLECCGACSTTHTTSPRWLDGDPGQPTPPPSRLSGRNSRWRHIAAANILSMPGAWDTADELHVVAPPRRCPGRRSPRAASTRSPRWLSGISTAAATRRSSSAFEQRAVERPDIVEPVFLYCLSMLSSRSASQPRRGPRAAPPSGPAAAR